MTNQENQEFFAGERVVATERVSSNDPSIVKKTYIGTVLGNSNNDSMFTRYHFKWDGDSEPGDSMNFPPTCPSTKTYDFQRLNETELEEGFEEALQTELGLVTKLADSGDLTKKAATLTSLRNLTRYLSEGVDREYQETERLSRESDITGRAAVLATLRNLNRYLEKRKSQSSEE